MDEPLVTMKEYYFLTEIIALADGQHALQITRKDTYEEAQMVMYQVLASAIANPDVIKAVVQISNDFGDVVKVERFGRLIS